MANGKVVVITGASHGIDASLVFAYNEAEYNVVANALSIEPSSNPSIINVPGDIVVAGTLFGSTVMSERLYGVGMRYTSHMNKKV